MTVCPESWVSVYVLCLYNACDVNAFDIHLLLVVSWHMCVKAHHTVTCVCAIATVVGGDMLRCP